MRRSWLRIGYLSAPDRLMSALRDSLLPTFWTGARDAGGDANELTTTRSLRRARTHREEAPGARWRGRSSAPALVAGPAATYHAWLKLLPTWQERATRRQLSGATASLAHLTSCSRCRRHPPSGSAWGRRRRGSAGSGHCGSSRVSWSRSLWARARSSEVSRSVVEQADADGRSACASIQH
jgi:hypothetical protein